MTPNSERTGTSLQVQLLDYRLSVMHALPPVHYITAQQINFNFDGNIGVADIADMKGSIVPTGIIRGALR